MHREFLDSKDSNELKIKSSAVNKLTDLQFMISSSSDEEQLLANAS